MPRKEANGLYPRGVIWDEDFFLVFTPEFDGKIYMSPPNIFSALPPSHSRYSGAGPASPIPPILPKPSSNCTILEKSKVKKAKQRSKTHFTSFSKSMPTSRSTLTPTIIALMKTGY